MVYHGRGRKERHAIRSAEVGRRHRCAMLSRVRREEPRARILRRRRGGCRHRELPEVHAIAGRGVDLKVATHRLLAGMLWHRLEKILLVRWEDRGRLLYMEGRHWAMQHREIDSDWHRSTALSLMSSMLPTRMQMWAETEMVILEHAHVWMMRSGKMHGGLRCRASDAHCWRYRGRCRHGIEIVGAMTVLE